MRQARLDVKPRVTDEFGRLKVVVVCQPDHLWWDTKSEINKWERKNTPPVISKAIEEHKRMVEAMESKGIVVVKLKPHEKLGEAAYTRDNGAVIDGTFYKSNMRMDVRKPEPDQIAIPGEVRFSSGEYLEGGDVLLPRKDMLYVGYGPRTSLKAVERLKREVDRDVIAFQLAPEEMHLDCGLAVFPGGHALLHPKAFADPDWAVKQVKKLFPHVELLDKKTYETMGANVQFLDEETMLSGNSKIARLLAEWKFNPIHMTFEELHKGGGSYRCCTLPLIREESGIYM